MLSNLLSITLTYLILVFCPVRLCIAYYSLLSRCLLVIIVIYLLKFNTEQELNVHIERCRKNVPGPSYSTSHICEYCQTSFMTAAELFAHVDTCEVAFITTVTSKLRTISNLLNEIMNKGPERVTLGQCHYCLWKLNTEEEVIVHRKTCKVLLTRNIIKYLYTNIKTILEEKHPMLSIPPHPPPPTPSTSKDLSEERKSPEKQENPRKRVLDTERDRATESESSPEFSSPPSKMFRFSDEDI